MGNMKRGIILLAATIAVMVGCIALIACMSGAEGEPPETEVKAQTDATTSATLSSIADPSNEKIDIQVPDLHRYFPQISSRNISSTCLRR